MKNVIYLKERKKQHNSAVKNKTSNLKFNFRTISLIDSIFLFLFNIILTLLEEEIYYCLFNHYVLALLLC